MDRGQQNLPRRALRKLVKRHPRRRRINEDVAMEVQEMHDLLFVGDVFVDAREEYRLLQALLAWLDSLTDDAA